MILIGGLALVFAALTPLYFRLLKERNNAFCKQNLKAIFDATRLYVEDNNQRFPPAFFDDGTGNPVQVDGRPITWASVVQPQIKALKHFKCPEATEEEAGENMPFSGKEPIKLTYGLYAPLAMRLSLVLSAPQSTVLFAETINGGAKGSYNPVPFSKSDSFLIGYSSGNLPTPETIQEADSVTRLAFRKDGDTWAPRHEKGIHVIFADGSLGTITHEEAKVQRRSRGEAELTGIWSTR